MPIFKARYNGKCQKCGGPVVAGQLVSWSRRQRGVVYHASCSAPDSDAQQGESGQGQGQGESQGQEQDQRSQERPQSPPEAPQHKCTGVDEARCREIAQEEDLANLDSIKQIIDKGLRKMVPASVVVTHRNGDGTETDREQIDNVHHEFERLLYLVNHGKHCYLYGPPGSGKSTGAVQAAKALKRRYGYISLNPQTPESRLLGFIDAGGIYRETEFFRCYTQGGVYCIDELDNAHPALLNTLNGMLETDADGVGRGAFPCGVVEHHADFVCVGTGNTNGRGGDKLFPERRALDSAFLERFCFLTWGYDEALEETITLAINPNALEWLAFVRQVRQFVVAHGIRLWASPRASFLGATLMKDSGWSAQAIAETVIFKGLDADTVTRITCECPLPKLGA